MTGSGDLISRLLALSLKMLAAGERIEPRPVAPAAAPTPPPELAQGGGVVMAMAK